MKKCILLIFACILFAGCARAPKDSYIERVAEVCGPEVAKRYASIKWRDRDFAHDSLLVECMAFPEEDR